MNIAMVGMSLLIVQEVKEPSTKIECLLNICNTRSLWIVKGFVKIFEGSFVHKS